MFSCFGCGSSSKSRTTTTTTATTKIVQTTTRNGQTITTTTYCDLPQSIPLWDQQLQPKIAKKLPNKATTSALPSAPFSSSQFEQQCLDEHNRLRALHGCPSLRLNSSMSAYANDWAKKLANRRTLQHRSNNKYGENLFMASGYNVDGKMVVKDWYDEIALYKYSRPSFSSGTGHFTQVIWKNSKELGVGVQKSGNSIWVVANYDPPGNFANEFAENVPKPLR